MDGPNVHHGAACQIAKQWAYLRGSVSLRSRLAPQRLCTYSRDLRAAEGWQPDFPLYGASAGVDSGGTLG